MIKAANKICGRTIFVTYLFIIIHKNSFKKKASEHKVKSKK